MPSMICCSYSRSLRTFSRHLTKLRFLLGLEGGVDDIVAGFNVTLSEALILFSTSVVMRSETLLIFLLHSSVA